MPGILIIAHAPLASALKTVARHTFPDCAAMLEALDVPPDMPIEAIDAEARALLDKVRRPQALILTDVFGATPCNVAQRLVDGSNVRLLVGVNVPMLWRSLSYAHEALEVMAARAEAGASQGVMQIAPSRPQNQTQKPGPNDFELHHDQ